MTMLRPVGRRNAGILTATAILCSLFLYGRASPGSTTQQEDDNDLVQVYEWHSKEDLGQYSQTSTFNLLAFDIPVHTLSAQFQVNLSDGSHDGVSRSVILALRSGGIPLINPYNETLPKDVIVPVSEQQILTVPSKINTTVVLRSSPLPGRLYIVASLLNPLKNVISKLQWGQKLSQDSFAVTVKATYKKLTRVASLPIDQSSSLSLMAQESLTRSFTIPSMTLEYSIIISQCNTTSAKLTTLCPLSLASSETLSPDSLTKTDCGAGNSTRCVLTVLSPLSDHDHYVFISVNDEAAVDRVKFNLGFDVIVCQSVTRFYPSTNYSAEDSSASGGNNTEGTALEQMDSVSNLTSLPSCLYLGPLGRRYVSGQEDFTFAAAFGGWTLGGNLVPNVSIAVRDDFMTVLTFVLQDNVDTGGILAVHATLVTRNWTGKVWLCVSAQRVPVNGSVFDSCRGGLVAVSSAAKLATALDKERHGRVLLPFPRHGAWYLAAQTQCGQQGKIEPCSIVPMIKVSVAMTQCPDNCGKFGKCDLFMAATTVFAACQCHAGYRGLSCSDGQYALTEGQQLTAVLLLTLSNFAFLPTVGLAIYRQFYTLAAIFFFNFFFSLFYHACDSNPVYQLCIMDYNSLGFSDFFGSILSFYAVLAFMARIPEVARTFLLMSGAMVIAMFQDHDRHNDLYHVMPLVFIGTILLVSWIREMKKRKALFPSKKRYFYFIIPGIVLALLGISINYGLMDQADKYQFSHSFWHFSVMLAPCFLMPPGTPLETGCKIPKSFQDISNRIGVNRRRNQISTSSEQQINSNEDGPLVPDRRDAASDRSLTPPESRRQSQHQPHAHNYGSLI